MPRLSLDAQLTKIKRQKAALEKKEHKLLSKAGNKVLKKVVALIKRAGLSVRDIADAIKSAKGRKPRSARRRVWA